MACPPPPRSPRPLFRVARVITLTCHSCGICNASFPYCSLSYSNLESLTMPALPSLCPTRPFTISSTPSVPKVPSQPRMGLSRMFVTWFYSRIAFHKLEIVVRLLKGPSRPWEARAEQKCLHHMAPAQNLCQLVPAHLVPVGAKLLVPVGAGSEKHTTWCQRKCGAKWRQAKTVTETQISAQLRSLGPACSPGGHTLAKWERKP